MPWIGRLAGPCWVHKKRAAGYKPTPATTASADMPPIHLTRVVLSVRDIPTVAAFYQQHFGLQPLHGAQPEPGWLELAPPGGGCAVALHQAAVSQKRGSEIKLVFGVADVPAFKAERAAAGLQFGPVLAGPGFQFANAKDPAGNAISVSSRGMA
jgi:predicted enzyme related to lactoylglutathione lyase